MKKRYFFVLLIFMVSLVFSGISSLKVKAIEASDPYETDDAMLEFMLENGLPNIAVPLACELELIFEQTSTDGGGFSMAGPSDLLKESYGFSAHVLAYRGGTRSVHLYLDIRFSADADIAENDILTIICPDGIQPNETSPPTQLLVPNQFGGWIEIADFTAFSYGSQNVHIALKDVLSYTQEHFKTHSSSAPENVETRILLYINGGSTADLGSALESMTVQWMHDPTESAETEGSTDDPAHTYPVVSPDMNIDKDTAAFSWKVILVVVVLALDVLLVLFVIRYLRKNVQKKPKNNAEKTSYSEDEISVQEAELQQNLKLKNEDIEYLRSIGYFDPDKK